MVKLESDVEWRREKFERWEIQVNKTLSQSLVATGTGHSTPHHVQALQFEVGPV
jgi:hypothetical protein